MLSGCRFVEGAARCGRAGSSAEGLKDERRGEAGEGFEYHILALGLGLVVVLAGAGKASVDLALSRSS